MNIVAIAKLLLERRGPRRHAESEAYGGGSTTLGLVATSVHPEQAGVQIELLDTLLRHGAESNTRASLATDIRPSGAAWPTDVVRPRHSSPPEARR